MSSALSDRAVLGEDIEHPVVVTFTRRGVRELVDHLKRHGKVNMEREERPRFDGNRRARRKAAAQVRRGAPASDLAPVDPDVILSIFAEAEAEVTRKKRFAEHLERTREWQMVQSLEGRIIDTATPEQRAAREAALDEEWERLRLLEQATEAASGNPAPGRDADLPAVGSFE